MDEGSSSTLVKMKMLLLGDQEFLRTEFHTLRCRTLMNIINGLD
jgi:hypothetical protein